MSAESTDEAGFIDEIVASVRRFVRDEVVPAETEIADTDAMPDRIRAAAAEMGLFGFAIPDLYGGLGLSMSDEVRLVFELGYTTPSFRSMFGTNNGIAGHVLLEGATEEQKKAYLPKIASGEWVASFALTEEGAGSDPAGLVTTARRDGDDWIINGSKRFITNAPNADVFMVFARSQEGSTGAKGISAFMVERGTPGLTVAPKDAKMGQAGAWTADVIFDDVRVGAHTLIGGPAGEGRGYVTAMKCLAHGRIHIAALCVGMCQRLVDESVSYASTRVQGGKVIGEHQLIQGLLADSVTDLYAARSLVKDVAAAFDDGSDRRVGPSAAKYFASEAVGRIADRAVQIHGGSGYMRGVPVERFYRDARLFRIYEGTSQIQQLVIARGVLSAAR
ncbi:Acyl-CoA dehydrogenase [Frankia canadensis]|uniref:Acyl-CoA dehydrogenase n=1 Tax=Frankia canadensis TaxID=1836972 RepID=A0A2I2KNP8_9ACTN|nr:acyl-CoA dehydrogenase family protein [Frankia canadensis]SNQ47293.1 Acyl-CoA dehydrogenase [Frankia canadensis]SOU54583.1 Acyl-CoA dehydrogenase [Frankia canadensis]